MARRTLLKLKKDCFFSFSNPKEQFAIPIVLDHINGDSTNWTLYNLRLICPNCDAQTNTYKGKNIGNGRHWRRQRCRYCYNHFVGNRTARYLMKKNNRESWETNRYMKRRARLSKHWCQGCDCFLLGWGQTCPRCGHRPAQKRDKKAA